MGRTKVLQNTFNSGILSPTAEGRVDIEKYYNSVRDALNVNAHPHGGLFKRKGLEYIDTTAGDGRLIRFAFNISQAYMLVFTNNNIAVYYNDTKIQDVTTTYTLAQVKVLGYAQSADTMIITQEDHIPRKLIRNSSTGVWSISDIALTNIPKYTYNQDYTNDGTSQTVTVEIGETVYNNDGNATNGSDLTYYKAKIQRVSIDLSTEDFSNTTNWEDLTTTGEEDVISDFRGYPKVCTFFESRLWFAGLKSRPQTILGSVTNNFYNFDLGTSLADEGIYDTLDTDQINPIVNIFPGRNLQVFTEGGEFANTSSPITPEDSTWKRSTNYGSKAGIRPELLDGATLFIDRSGRNLREFIYAYEEDNYTAQSASTLAYDIINAPVDITLIRGTDEDISNLVMLVNADGTMAVFNTLRIEQVAGWTRYNTDGLFKSVENLYDDTYFLVSRDNGYFLEKSVMDTYLDSHVTYTAGGSAITGLTHLEGQEVQIVADGSVMLPQTVTSGSVTTERSFTTAEVGLLYNTSIETLPLAPNLGGGSSVNAIKRIIKTTLRVIDTKGAEVNGKEVSFKKFGVGILDSPVASFSGIKEIRHLGFGKLENFTITSNRPVPFKILSVESEVTTK